ncbi:MAG: uracil-DNA glycosylase [Ottowia sp.]|nr:uracil-DNA glycosylase [Ottowia sp.]
MQTHHQLFLDALNIGPEWVLREIDVPSKEIPQTVSMMDWETLEKTVTACQQCNLCQTRTQTVFGAGSRQADWLIIGEAPGEQEDRRGQAFVGQAGQLLDNMLHAIGLSRARNTYIANVLKCRPPGNRDPHPEEIAQCTQYLHRQITLLQPKCIILLGRFAAQTLLQTASSISKLRGQIHQYNEIPVIVTYHPAYLLRRPEEKAKAWADLCMVQGLAQLA